MSYNPYKPQRIGNLRDTVVLQSPTNDGISQPQVWQDEARVYARVEPAAKGGERYVDELSQLVSQDWYYVHMRYHTEISTTWRVIWERAPNQHRILDIRRISNDDERKRFLRLECRGVAEDEADTGGGEEFYLEAEPLTSGTVNEVYSFEIGVVGGVEPFTFSRVDDGSPVTEIDMPSGLVLAQADTRIWVCEGYPSAAGTYQMRICCVDGDGLVAYLDPFTLTISA